MKSLASSVTAETIFSASAGCSLLMVICSA